MRAELIEDGDNRQRMQTSIDEMSAMVESALDFARAASSAEASRVADLNALADSICEDLRDLGEDVTFTDGEPLVVNAGVVVLSAGAANSAAPAAANPFPTGVDWEWTGDQEDQAESGAFLMKAFAGALGLMFIILLAQFNSFYNSVLVLLAVILSTAGVLVGMVVMELTVILSSLLQVE